MKIAIIAAMTKNQIIGINNNLPWKIAEELQYFRKITLYKPIIMGSNTFRSIKMKPLKDRYNIVLTSKPDKIYTEINKDLDRQDKLNFFDNLVLVNNLQESILKAKEFYNRYELNNFDSEIMIIGGREIYKQFLPLADRLYLSIIKKYYTGNVFFPEYDLQRWKLIFNIEYAKFFAKIWDKKI